MARKQSVVDETPVDQVTVNTAVSPPVDTVQEDKKKPAESPKDESPKQEDKKWNALAYINSPWIFLAVAMLLGGVWLIFNSWVIADNLDKPYALLAGPTLVGSVLVGWLIVKFFSVIFSSVKAACRGIARAQKKDGSAQFFWTVIVVFMIVSVFASGTFFNTLEHNVVPGLGYVTALFIDLVAVQAMRARLNAVRMRDKKGANLYLFGVLLCAGASAFANVYTSLADFNQHLTGALPPWMLQVGPWFGLTFPALILLLSMTADYTLDQTSTKLDPEQYKAQENKRTKLLEYQRDALKERVILEQEIDRYTAELQQKRGQRAFFLVEWLFPKVRVDASSQIEEMKVEFESRLYEMVIQIEDRFSQFATYSQQMYVGLEQRIQQQLVSIDSQKDTDLSLVMQQIEEAKGQAIHASLLQISQIKDEMISAARSDVKGVRDTDELHTDPTLNTPSNTMEDSGRSQGENTTKKGRISKDLSGKNSAEDSSLDEATKTVLVNYPFLAAEHSKGTRSLTIDEIVKYTGHTAQLVNARRRKGVFNATKRPGFYSMASITKWLETEKMPAAKDTTILAESSDMIQEDFTQNSVGDSGVTSPRITGKLSENMVPENVLKDIEDMVI